MEADKTLMARVCLGLVWLSVAAVVAGFVLPWATLDVTSSRVAGRITQAVHTLPFQELAGKLSQRIGRVSIQVKRGTRTLRGELLPDLSQIPTRVDGPQIPQLANRQGAQVALALAEMLTGEQELGTKSYAVYLVPGLALLCGALVTVARRVRAVCLLVGILCVTVASVGWWKLATAKTDTLLVAITIGQGLWVSLWAYAGLGVAALALALMTHSRAAT